MSDEQPRKPGIDRPEAVQPYELAPSDPPNPAPPPAPVPAPVPVAPTAGIPVGTPVNRPPEKPAAPLGGSLIAEFDEDADFSKDPEVERALSGGKPVKGSEPLVEVPPPPPLVKEGWGDAASVALVSCGLLLGAVIVACVNASGPWYKAGIAAIYLTVLQAACGVGALGVEAFLNKRPLGPLDLAAARMLGAVALFVFLLRLNLPIPGRFDEPVFAAAGYFAAVMLLFRFPARTAFHVSIIHAILAIVTWGILALHAWVAHVPPQPPVTP